MVKSWVALPTGTAMKNHYILVHIQEQHCDKTAWIL